jgi:hypothetical protein
MKNGFLSKIHTRKYCLSMSKGLLLIVISLISLISCSSYIPLTRDLVVNKKLTAEDLELLQFYSYNFEIKYKGADIKKTSEGIKSGELFKGEQIERNFVIIPKRTSGAVKRVILDEKGIPGEVHVLYDTDLPLITYTLISDDIDNFDYNRVSSSDNNNGYFCLIDNQMTVNNAIYKNITGYKSKIFINKDELQKLIEHKKFAKGIKVGGTKLIENEEIIKD